MTAKLQVYTTIIKERYNPLLKGYLNNHFTDSDFNGLEIKWPTFYFSAYMMICFSIPNNIYTIMQNENFYIHYLLF